MSSLIIFDLVVGVSYPSVTMRSMKRLLTSCFGLGWQPICPGTWGSLPPAIVFFWMCKFNVSAFLISISMGVLALAGSAVCVILSPAVIKETGKTDPREVVADEFAGQAVTFLAAPFFINTFSVRQLMVTALLGFLLFRLFDILKPFPIYRIQKLPKGWGILADDLLAGVYAAVVLQVCLSLGVIEYFS
jgi:phosphatidylglycerophosphatase A